MKKAIIQFLESEDPVVFFVRSCIVIPAAGIGLAVFTLFAFRMGKWLNMTNVNTNKTIMTELDEKLREIALKDWPRFVSMVGESGIRDAKACLLRSSGFSFGQVGNKLGIPKENARYACKKCEVVSVGIRAIT